MRSLFADVLITSPRLLLLQIRSTSETNADRGSQEGGRAATQSHI